MLDCLLPEDSEAAFKGECDRLAGRLQKGSRKGNGGLVERFLWGLATRLTEYVPPPEGHPPLWRRSGPLSWCEKYIIKLAAHTDSKEAKAKRVAPPDPAYLAPLLRRTLADTTAAWQQYGPAQGRGAGFGILPPKE